jgi:hypothetical protein
VTTAHWTDYSKNANILPGPLILRVSLVRIYFVRSWQWPTMSTKLMPNPAYATLGSTWPLHIGQITLKMPISYPESYWVLEFCGFHLCEFSLCGVGNDQQRWLNWYQIPYTQWGYVSTLNNSDRRFDSQLNGKLGTFWYKDKTRLIFGLSFVAAHHKMDTHCTCLT